MKMQNNAEVKASSPIRTSLFEREDSMWGRLKRPSPRPTLIEECRSDDSDLCHELTDRYGFTPEEMHRAAERYHLGRSKSGKTIYWMIDHHGIVRDGHIGNGWVSQMFKYRYPEAASYIRPKHCLFGQHLLTQGGSINKNHPDPLMGRGYLNVRATGGAVEPLPTIGEGLGSGSKSSLGQGGLGGCEKLGFKGVPPLEHLMPVGIVESERSAVILSEARPELLWMAYAYPLNLTVDLFEPFQGRTVTLFPRTDPNQDNYYASLEFADQVRRLYHLDFRVSRLLEDRATPAQKSVQIDLADFIMNVPQI